ncbi:oxygen-independent coproporphyrinogen III oxidase [Glaciecola petra]|uniref:Coproporphyrinogen-III oxidase n=1 Tax=Glaciecola petra TaxID=3075602 RepID=A0ABU2ZN71_9ALTE|nr:oxygen-independent coproporphyrinogen III oxidase [Aestuariibacter sp. P117]MDT0594073.1 oxygen-independent coproporphyrinogen III oxidase [Aestuariibacter sp. P117]
MSLTTDNINPMSVVAKRTNHDESNPALKTSTDIKINEICDLTLLQKYNTSGPRYTSYPTAVSFTHEFNENDFKCSVEELRHTGAKDSLSLYIHIPFCHSLCYYCACNKIVTRNNDKLERYLHYLKKEIQQRSQLFVDFTVDKIHFGGGTPSFLSPKQLAGLLSFISKKFTLSEDLDQSIEIDPRNLPNNFLRDLFLMGFNRLSFGVQDVNKSVQEKINRVQSTALLISLIDRAKQLGFASINVDLIYGLPGQNIESLKQTLRAIKHLDPDRISLFSYAHMPKLFAAQRKIKDEWLPDTEQKFTLFNYLAINLIEQGYHFIGMDHFAKPKDELCVAAREKRLYRNFQGYTTDKSNCILGIGVSSISSLGRSYAQNVKNLNEYYAAIDRDVSILDKGLILSLDDEIRRSLIQQLMCNFYVDKNAFSKLHQIDFDVYFAKSLSELVPLVKDGLLSETEDAIYVHAKGRLLIRNICINFDAHIGHERHKMRYSRVI